MGFKDQRSNQTAARMARRIATVASRPTAPDTPASVVKVRRQESRQPVFRHGRIVLSGGGTADCTIIDVSESGARIQLDGAKNIPELVTLKIIATGAARRARVMWRTENQAGLAFVVEPNRPFGSRWSR